MDVTQKLIRARLTDGEMLRGRNELRFDGTVRWLGDVTAAQLAAEYNGRRRVLSAKHSGGLGIVFLEADGPPQTDCRGTSIRRAGSHPPRCAGETRE